MVSPSPECAKFFDQVSRRLRAAGSVFHIEGDGLDLYLKRGFLTEAECSTLISLIDSSNAPSTVLNGTGRGVIDDHRSSDSSSLYYERHPIISEIDRRILELVGISAPHGEGLEGQRYSQGQQFKPHFDYFVDGESYWPDQQKSGGQRTWTVLLCLAAPDDGGATLFPKAGVRVKARAGNLLAWCNVDANGCPNENSLHSGEPVVLGTKYVMTKWFRERPFIEAINPVTHLTSGQIALFRKMISAAG